MLRVLHFTDVHLDLRYRAGAKALCKTPPCCRDADGTVRAAGSAVPGDDAGLAAPIGHPNCDSSPALVRSAMDVGAELDPDVILWTGDTVAHGEGAGDAPPISREEALAAIANVTVAARRAMPRAQLFPVLGNRDFVPAHTYAAFAGTSGGSQRNGAWLLRALADGPWHDVFADDEAARRTFAYGGFYKVRARTPAATDRDRDAASPSPHHAHTPYNSAGRPPLYVIGLNTEVCHVRNLHAFVDEAMAEEQLRWLHGALASLAAEGAHALIAGHIAPGIWSGCWGKYSEAYERIVAQYSGGRDNTGRQRPRVVLAQFFGHQHSGSFRLLYDRTKASGMSNPDGAGTLDLNAPKVERTTAGGNGGDARVGGSGKRVAAVAHVTPSLTPFRNQQPSMRIYTLALPSRCGGHGRGGGEDGGGEDGGEGGGMGAHAGGWAPTAVRAIAQYYVDLEEAAAAQRKKGSGEPTRPVEWFLSFEMPQALGLPDLSLASWERVADAIARNATIRDDFIALEANGRREFMAPSKGSARAYPCGVRHVEDGLLQRCAGMNEEQFIRDYTGRKHTYVLSGIFDFGVLLERFCGSLVGILAEDCARSAAIALEGGWVDDA